MKNPVFISLMMIGCVLIFGACSSGGSDSGNTESFKLDATGTWTGRYTISGIGTKGFEASVVQTGSSLSGTISIPSIDIADATLTGTVTGNRIEFGNIEKTISFSGTAEEDDTASGDYNIVYEGKTYTGSWEGVCIRAMVPGSSIDIPGYSYQGIAWDGNQFWVSDGQILHGISKTGNETKTYSYNDLEFLYHSFNTLCWDGTHLWAVEDGYGDDFDKARFCLINVQNGEIEKNIDCPPDGSSPSIGGSIGIGPAWDGTYIWCLRCNQDMSYTIYKLKASDGSVQGTLSVPKDPLNEGGGIIMPGGFGFAEGTLLIVDRTGYIFKLRTSDGKVIQRYKYSNGSGSDLGGICWDGSFYWIRDTTHSKLLEFPLPSGRL